MITVEINDAGLNAVIARLKSVDALRDRATVTPLLEEMQRVMYEDNRRGVMMSQDKDGKPAPPLRYRGSAAIQPGVRSRSSGGFGRSTRVSADGKTVLIRGRARGRLNSLGRLERSMGEKVSTAGYAVLPNNNLRADQYQQLTGPRLAPRRDQSRVIANYLFKAPRQMSWGWLLTGYWRNVLTPKGRALLPMHFDATRPGMKYDLRGVRPWGVHKCRQLAKVFVLKLIGAGA